MKRVTAAAMMQVIAPVETLNAAAQAGVLVLVLVFLIVVTVVLGVVSLRWLAVRGAQIAAQPKPLSPETVSAQLDSLNAMVQAFHLSEQNRAREIEMESVRFRDRVETDAKVRAQFDRMLDQLEKDHTRMHDNEASMMRGIQEEIEAKKLLAASIEASNTEHARQNKEIETKLATMKTTIDGIKGDIGVIKEAVERVKASVGPDGARNLSVVENGLTLIVRDFTGLITEFRDLVQTLHRQTAATAASDGTPAPIPQIESPEPERKDQTT